MNVSVNGKIVCKPYGGTRKIEAQVKSGFASVKQKNTLVGLEVLVDAYINEDITIDAGSKVYISEELLFNYMSVNKPLESDAVKESFVLIDFGHIVLIKDE